MSPAWHGFVEGVQARPAVQALHVPPLQTADWVGVLQFAPFGREVPVSTQTCVPVEQSVVPT